MAGAEQPSPYPAHAGRTHFMTRVLVCMTLHLHTHRRSFYGKYTAKHCYQQPAVAAPFLTAGGGDGGLGMPRLRSTDDQHPYADALAIVMLRNPYDWALAMHINCW